MKKKNNSKLAKEWFRIGKNLNLPKPVLRSLMPFILRFVFNVSKQ